MKTVLVLVTVTAACAGLFFCAPHHRRNENMFKPCTLAGIYGQIFHEAPEVMSPSVLFFVLLWITGVVSAFYPALFVALARWVLPGASGAGGALFIWGGLIAAIGAFGNFLAIVVSHLNLGFGSAVSHDETPFYWIIPLFHLVFAVASFAIGCSSALAIRIGQWLV